MKNGPYTLVVPPKSYPGKRYRGKYAYEHHVVWWEHKKTLVPDNYIVHHKNHIKTDNRISNLDLMSKSNHGRKHNGEPQIIKIECAYCKKIFIREARNYNIKIKRGQKLFYCCRSHHAIEQQRQRRTRSNIDL